MRAFAICGTAILWLFATIATCLKNDEYTEKLTVQQLSSTNILALFQFEIKTDGLLGKRTDGLKIST